MFTIMFRFAVLCVTLACVGVDCQPTGCTDDTHCPADFFCDAHFCHECLHCVTFLREDPIVPTKCIQSVTECGPCKKGLVDDHGGDASVSCVAAGGGDDTWLYVWIIAGVAVALIPVTTLIICTFASSKLFLLKVSGFTSAHTFQGGGGGVGVGAGEPQSSAPPMPPPPYNTHFSDTPLYPRDEACPLVKEGAGRGGREAERRQAARVFNNPAYVRTPHQPHTPTPPPEEEPSPEPAALHDEDTMESVWTPVPSPPQHPHTHENGERDADESAVATVEEAGGAAGRAGGAPAATRRALADAAGPPAKHLCLPLGEGSRSSSGSREEGGGGAGPSVMLNFNLNVNANAVQQLNNVTLFE